MQTLRTILAAVLVLALAANPLLAAVLMPCCCAGKAADSQCPACQAADTLAKPAQPATAAESDCCQSCCHQTCCEAAAAERANSSPMSIEDPDCNCVKSLPTSTLVRDKISPPTVEQLWLVSHAPQTIDPVVPAVRHFVLSDELITPTGPPLLALYCIWLK